MKNKYLTYTITLLVIFMGCSPPPPGPEGTGIEAINKEKALEQVPTWYTTTPIEEGYIYAKGEGSSSIKRGARKIAINQLINDFQLKTKAITEGRSEDFFEQSGGAFDTAVKQRFEDSQAVIWSGVVQNYEETNTKTFADQTINTRGQKGEVYRTYVVARINRFDADQLLLEKLKNEQELLTAIAATNAYQKLRDDLERYRKKLGMEN